MDCWAIFMAWFKVLWTLQCQCLHSQTFKTLYHTLLCRQWWLCTVRGRKRHSPLITHVSINKLYRWDLCLNCIIYFSTHYCVGFVWSDRLIAAVTADCRLGYGSVLLEDVHTPHTTLMRATRVENRFLAHFWRHSPRSVLFSAEDCILWGWIKFRVYY